MDAPHRITHTKKKDLLSTSNPFEKQFGYHRAVRRGPFIAVSGTTALKLSTTNGDKVEHPGDALGQARLSMDRCIEAVEALGGTLEDIVRIRMFVANSEDCAAVGSAYREKFGTGELSEAERDDIIGAAATMVVVKDGFVDGGILVEVEAEAYCV